MKNSAIFSSKLNFFILTSLRKPRQSICSCIRLALAIIDLKMILRELLGPSDLSATQTLCTHKTTEVIVVYKNKNLMLAAFYVVAPYLESFDNSQKLAVVSLVLCFRWNHFSQKKWYWMLLAQIGLSNYPIWPSSGS